MNYNFTSEVRLALEAAREEAAALENDYVGTAHLLLGLLHVPESVAVQALGELGIGAQALRGAVLEIVRLAGKRIVRGSVPYTSRAKKVLEFAIAEARELKHSEVGTEHLLLGLVREEKGIAAQVLNSFGADLESLRAAVTGSDAGQAARLSIEIDDTSEQSIYEQIVARVQEGVATGVLKRGRRLPAVRRLADQLDVAPGTVARAYSELERLGVVVTEGARGTRVAGRARGEGAGENRPEVLAGLLRPVAVAAFHMGSSAPELRVALEEAMAGIFS